MENELKKAQRAREIAHEQLVAMTRSDFQVAGQKCVESITTMFSNKENFGWDFVDLDPDKFRSIRDATLMGLRATSLGSEASGHSLVSAQIERTMASIREYSSDVAMKFVISERIDSFGGLKEVLQLHKCSFNSADRVYVYETDRFIMN